MEVVIQIFKFVGLYWNSPTNVTKHVLLISSCLDTFTGGWRIDNKANSVQFQMKFPTGTELGNIISPFSIMQIYNVLQS
jgi:hypothetical protein